MTFLQVSDLHFGHVDPNNQNGQFNSAAPNYWAYCSWLQGLVGHHYRAVQQLSAFHRHLRPEKPMLLVTGDLTCCGHDDQFETANDFLGSTLQLPKGRDGLGVKDWARAAISGNHDQWPGTGSPFGGPGAGLGKYIRSCPTVDNVKLPNGMTLRFIRLDTDANVANISLQRFLAQGEFTKLLAKADSQLGPPADDQIRVLLLHHSRIYGHPHMYSPLVMLGNSRSALDDFLVDNDIRVMLCGHTHVARVKRHGAAHKNGQKLAVLECCCGTTTQRDTVPATWKNIAGKRPNSKLNPNTLIVHRLVENGGALRWEVQPYLRHNKGFLPMPRLRNGIQVSP